MLSDPTRVRLLHAVSTAPSGSIKVGDLADRCSGISQSTCSHHVRKLADVGFVAVDKVGTASIVSVNPACCTGLPHAADVVMGTLGHRAVLPRGPAGRRVDASPGRRRPGRGARHLRRGHRHPQRHLRDRGAARRDELADEVAARAPLGGRARRHASWAGPPAAPVSDRECYAGVGRDQRLRHRVRPRPGRRQGPAAPPGHRGRPPAACGRCRRRSSPRTAHPSRSTTRPATGLSPCGRASPSSTVSGATPSSSSGVARTILTHEHAGPGASSRVRLRPQRRPLGHQPNAHRALRRRPGSRSVRRHPTRRSHSQ